MKKNEINMVEMNGKDDEQRGVEMNEKRQRSDPKHLKTETNIWTI